MRDPATSSLIAHLRSVLPQDGTRDALITSVIPTLLQSIADIAKALRNSHHVAAAGTANTFGDDRMFSFNTLQQHH
jgi:sedoheptulose-bisphosphatase